MFSSSPLVSEDINRNEISQSRESNFSIDSCQYDDSRIISADEYFYNHNLSDVDQGIVPSRKLKYIQKHLRRGIAMSRSPSICWGMDQLEPMKISGDIPAFHKFQEFKFYNNIGTFFLHFWNLIKSCHDLKYMKCTYTHRILNIH